MRETEIATLVAGEVFKHLNTILSNNTEQIVNAIGKLPKDLLNPNIINEVVKDAAKDAVSIDGFEETIAKGVRQGIVQAAANISQTPSIYEPILEKLGSEIGEKILTGLVGSIDDFKSAVLDTAGEYRSLIIGIAIAGAISSTYKDEIKHVVKESASLLCSPCTNFWSRMCGRRKSNRVTHTTRELTGIEDLTDGTVMQTVEQALAGHDLERESSGSSLGR